VSVSQDGNASGFPDWERRSRRSCRSRSAVIEIGQFRMYELLSNQFASLYFSQKCAALNCGKIRTDNEVTNYARGSRERTDVFRSRLCSRRTHQTPEYIFSIEYVEGS